MPEAVKIAEIRNYLKTEFPGFGIDIDEDGADAVLFSLATGDARHLLAVDHDFIERRGPADLAADLQGFGVADTLRSLGDFRVRLTESGCIFD